MASTSAPVTTPRRPGGARPRPTPQLASNPDDRPTQAPTVPPQYQASRPAPVPSPQPPRLSIPPGNVRINVDQAGEGGWHMAAGLPPAPSVPAVPRRPAPPLPMGSVSNPSTPGPSGSALPQRPKLSISSVAPASAPVVTTLERPYVGSSGEPTPPARLEASRLAPGIPPRLGGGSRSSTPSLKLAIPLGGSGGSGFSSAYDEDGGSQILTPIPGEDRDATVHANRRSRVADRQPSPDYGGGGAYGGLNPMDAMTENLRATMDRLRFDSSPAPSASHSRSTSNAHEKRRNNGSLEDDLRSLRSIALPPNAIDDEPHSRESSRPNSFHGSERALDASDLSVIRHLGEGAGGAVDLVQTRDGQVLARKIITRTPNPSMHKQLVRELEFLSSTCSPYIVQNYGAFLAENDSQICILMEYCEAGSLDYLQRRMREKNMHASEHVLGRIASSVLRGLDYLQERRIIHRDIKPSNIVLTLDGEVKLCDFGVSGELIESEVNTYMGTALYMAPERIQNKPYSIRADVWSLGVTLLEVAHLRHPFPPEGEPPNPTPFELIAYINILPLPTFVDDPEFRVWTPEIKDFVAQCLIRDGRTRPGPRQLLQHPYIVRSEAKNVNMARWVNTIVS